MPPHAAKHSSRNPVDIEAVRAQAEKCGDKPRVYCEEWGKPLIHSQPWVRELVEAAGGQFVGDAGKATTAEAVAASRSGHPHLRLVRRGRSRAACARYRSNAGWQSMRAVAEGRVYCIPDEFLNTPAHPLLDRVWPASPRPYIQIPFPRIRA